MASRGGASMGRQQQHRSPTSVAEHGHGGEDVPPQAAGGAKHVTPPATAKRSAKKNNYQNPDMICKEKEVDECLLICGVIGSHQTDSDGNDKFVPVTDCLKWLQDLQRVLRRDNDIYRPISLFLGKCRAVSQKLMPLVVNCRYDKGMVLTLCKILVLLTKPMSDDAKNAGRMTVDVKSGKVDADIIKEQIILRDNAIEQSDLLMEYKKLFTRHASHHYALRTQQGDTTEESGTGLLSIFTNLLAEPLSKIGSQRSPSDHLTIELVLHLIRNLLTISPINNFGSTEKSQYASQLHRELIIVLEKEMVLDVLVCLGQEVERRENKLYNLLLMEIISCLLRGQDPSDIALSAFKSSPVPLSAPKVNITNNKKKPSSKAKAAPKTRIITATRASNSGSGGGALKAHLQSERQKLQLSASSRHSHFGGTLLLTKPSGQKTYVSASDYLTKKSNRESKSETAATKEGRSTAGLNQPVRRKNKKAEVFVGSIKSSALHSRPGASVSSARSVAGPTSKRAYLALNTFMQKFIEDCYGPVMKSLKNEFRRDSARLETGDKVMFFRIVWFFHQWWRVGLEQKQSGEKLIAAGSMMAKKKSLDKVTDGSDDKPSKSGTAQNLIFTMDVFMFNLVLNSTDEFHEHKKPAALAQTVALYTEMIHMLHAMYDSADSTERMMALGLMDRIYYATEPLDRLPRLLSRWAPGMYSREYLCDLVECSHVTWKLLDANAKRCNDEQSTEEQKRPKDAVERMNMTASEFDKDHYFMRKFLSNQIVFMYTQLLSQYDVNAAHVNKHIVAYFVRLCKFSVKNAGNEEGMEYDDALGKNNLVRQEATFEPMLYNIGLFTVLDTVLNDGTIRDTKNNADNNNFEALLMFASSFMKRFARAAEANPMLYVEALFKHPVPHKFCELATNMYVNEELRMIAVRDLLLEDQKRYEGQEEDEVDDNANVTAKTTEKEGNADDDKVAVAEKAQGYDDEEEEELEFNDDDMDTDGIVPTKKKKRRRKSKKSRKLSKTSSVEEEEEDQPTANEEENDDDELNEKSDDNDSDPKFNESPSLEASSEGPEISNMEKNEQDALLITDGSSPKLSGKKRIRKSLDKGNNDDVSSDDDEDFLGSASTVPSSAKLTKRVIFDDDDDD